MKKVYAILFLIGVLFFSGCASSNVKQGSDSEIVNGRGLEVDFQIDDNRISVGKIAYKLTLENSGKNPVELVRGDNFKIRTKQDWSSGEIITSESINSFYSKIFEENNERIIRNGEEIIVSGVLEINPDFLREADLENIDLEILINYNYKTEFTNNVIIDTTYEMGTDLFKVDGNVKQAAPVQITKIKLEPTLSKGNYELNFYFDDKGNRQMGDDGSVKLSNLKFEFSRDDIASSCKPYYEIGDKFQSVDEYVLNENVGDFVVICEVSIDENLGFYNTIISGSFEYDYNLKFTETIDLPEKDSRN